MANEATAAAGPQAAPRREQYKERTRLDLAVAAFELARKDGLAEVRVPQIAAAAGVSARTFNNYFASKEQAIAWLAGRHAAGMAAALRERPAGEPLGQALVEAVLGQYRPAREDGLPPHWLRDFQGAGGARACPARGVPGRGDGGGAATWQKRSPDAPHRWGRCEPRCWPRWWPGPSGPR